MYWKVIDSDYDSYEPNAIVYHLVNIYVATSEQEPAKMDTLYS